MKLTCSKCQHTWETRKNQIPVLCPRCKYSTYYHRPIIVRK